MAGTKPLDDEAILRRYGIELDPVIEAYKKDVDRTLLRENLRRTPEERSAYFPIAELEALLVERERALLR